MKLSKRITHTFLVLFLFLCIIVSISACDPNPQVESSDNSIENSLINESGFDISNDLSADESLDESVDVSDNESVDESVDVSGDESVDESVDVSVDESIDESVDISADESVDESEEPQESSVPEIIYVTKIEISGKTSVEKGKTVQLSAKVFPSNATNPKIRWTIKSGSDCGSIDQNGLVTTKKSGTIVISAISEDGSEVNSLFTIKINEPIVLIKDIEISGNNTVEVGKTVQLTASVSPSNASNKKVTWSISSGSSKASIDKNGILTAKAAGTVTVKAKADDDSGVSDTFTITIKEPALWEGSGTKNDPFLIKNLTDLKNLTKVLNKKGYYFKQVADIDCSSVKEWIVIGDYENDGKPFRHNYNGNGHTISNICLDGDASALISYAEDAHFENIKIINAHTSDNARTEENKTGLYPGTEGSTAALVGSALGCTFENCSATVNFESSNEGTAGLVAHTTLKEGQGDLMVNCHVTGNISGAGKIGGLISSIGRAFEGEDFAPHETDIHVKNCSTDVNISVKVHCLEKPNIGGLIGYANLVIIENCYAKGSINVIDGDIGGLVGYSMYACDITRCYADVDIYASSDNHYGRVCAGGLVGQMLANVSVYECYATGDVTAPYVEWSPCQDDSPRNGGPWLNYYNPCGSLIGAVKTMGNYGDYCKLTIYHNYATGKVNVPNICEDERLYCHGALVGVVYDTYTRNYIKSEFKKKKEDISDWSKFEDTCIYRFEDNYNIEDLRTYYTPINDYEGSNTLGMQNPFYSKMPTHEYVEIITEQQLVDQRTFEGWDFENIWKMGENGPTLR